MGKPAKRIGRPTKTPKGRVRVALGLKVTAETKRVIDQMAQASGRTQSQQAEFLIERALQFDRTLAAMGTTLADMQTGNIEATLFRLGYTPIRSPREGKVWKLWAEPGFPGVERSGFVP
jgi:hypothetical protein